MDEDIQRTQVFAAANCTPENVDIRVAWKITREYNSTIIIIQQNNEFTNNKTPTSDLIVKNIIGKKRLYRCMLLRAQNASFFIIFPP